MMAWLMSDRAVAILAYSLQFASESPTQYFLSLEVLPTQKTVFFPVNDAHSAMERAILMPMMLVRCRSACIGRGCALNGFSM